jgi:hypothetical protein
VSCTCVLFSVPGYEPEQCAGLHLESPESGHASQLSRVLGLQGAVVAVGPHGVFLCGAWKRAEGRDLWGACRPWYVSSSRLKVWTGVLIRSCSVVLLQRYLPTDS